MFVPYTVKVLKGVCMADVAALNTFDTVKASKFHWIPRRTTGGDTKNFAGPIPFLSFKHYIILFIFCHKCFFRPGTYLKVPTRYVPKCNSHFSMKGGWKKELAFSHVPPH